VGKANVAMEAMIVLQLAYVTLLSQEKMEVTFGGLAMVGKYTAGFNVEFFGSLGSCQGL